MTFQRLTIAVTCLLLLPAAFAQTSQRRHHIDANEEAEHKMDAPAKNVRHGTSHAPMVVFGPYHSVQVNVDSNGNNITGDAANEPSITVDPNNPNHIAIGWRQFDSVNSNFRQGGYGYSTDGGKSWTFPGVLENNVFRSDPVLATDTAGGFWYLSLLDSFYDTLWFSLNWGQNWSQVGPAEGGDKEWMVIDRTNSSGHGFTYQTWSTAGNNYGGAQFTRSTNGGQTWMNPINIPNQPFWGTLDVGPNGECYVCGTDGNGTLWFERSSNAKNGSVTPSFDLVKSVNMGGQINYGQPINPDGLSGQLWICADRSGSPTNGNIYLLSSLTPNSGSDPLNVMFSRSTNGGTTWSSAVKVNDDPLNSGHYHWMASMSIAPNGRLDAVWLDTRNDSTARTSALYYSYSLDAGVTWSANTQVSPSFNQSVGYPNQNKMGDYMGSISDNTSDAIAYSATFNNEEDVYFLRIPAVNQLPPASFSILQGTLISGNDASLAYADGNVLTVQNKPTVTVQQPPLQVQYSATSALMSPSKLTFKYVASASSTGLTQTLSLYNFTSNAYEVVDSRPATVGLSTVTVTPSGDLSRFVNQSTGEVRALGTYRATGPVSQVGWQASIDQVQWTIYP